MAPAFDPYHKWLGIPADQQPPNCYRLLGIRDFEGDVEVIQAGADQRTTHLRSFQNSPHANLAARLLSEVEQARNRLLDADDKTEYDAQLREILARSASEGSPPIRRAWPDGRAPSTVEEFHQCLEASRVMSADDSRQFLNNLPEGKRPKTAKSLAIELLKANKLTRHQADSVLKGKIKYLAFGEYIILEKLGQGGMGQVLKAEHRRMRRTVALKVISGPMMKDADTVRRFQREVHAAARLIHPNIVTAFDANEHEGVHFFVMEYVEGRDLAELVNDEGPLPVAQAVDYVLQAARGLAYAHGKGIVHRDIKPANLLLDDEGTVKILDMGLARMELSADDGQELTNTGQVMGTVDYMAPEQAEDTHAVDARADIYSLGCTLYRLLAGQVLYSADTVVKKLLAHRSKPIPFLGTVCRGIPRELEVTFQKMVAKRPEDRQPTMAHVVAELEACLRGSSPSGTFPRSTESTIDFPLSDIVSNPGSRPGNPSSAAVVPRAEKTQSAGTEVTQDFTKGETCGAGILPALNSATFESGGVGVSPALSSVSLKSRLAKSRLSLLVAAALGGLALLAAGIVIFLPAGDGTIRIEIEDPSIEVTVAASGYKIKGKTEEIHITPGEHTLHIKTGDLEFDTTKFTLGKGENPAVKVELLPEKVQVVSADGKSLGERARPQLQAATAAVPADHKRGLRYALDFSSRTSDGRTAHVDCDLPLRDDQPFTLEMYVTARIAAVSDSRGLIELDPGYTLKQHRADILWMHEARKGDYDEIRTGTLEQGRRTNLTAVVAERELRLFIDGRLVGKTPLRPREGQQTRLLLGRKTRSELWSPFDGTIDELRVSKGARYQESFTPVARFELDSDTLALYHFDEGQGDTLKDSSGNNHHGKIVGAKWVNVAAPSATSSIPNPKSKIENQNSSPPWSHRSIAEWVIQRGGKVMISGTTEFAKPEDLPPGTWRLYHVDLDNIKSVGDDEAAIIAEWPDISGLSIARTSITDAGLRKLARLKLGGSLNISGTSITGEGFDAFAGKPIGTLVMSTNYLPKVTVAPCPFTPGGWQKLAAIGPTPRWYIDAANFNDGALQQIVAKHLEIEVLASRSPDITDGSAEHLATLPKLNHLLLYTGRFTDSGLSILQRVKSLRHIDISRSKVTTAGVTAFHQAVPECKIIWPDGTVDPEPAIPSANKK